MSEILDILQEKGESLGGQSQTAEPVSPAGGSASSGKASSNKKIDPKAKKNTGEGDTPPGEDGNADDQKAKAAPSMFKPSSSKAKTPAPNQTVKEEIDDMFESHDLSEDFKEKAAIIFEAAFNARINEEVQRLDEAFEERLQEQTEIGITELVEKVDAYLDYVVERWVESNEVAIESGIRTEMSESFMSSLYELMAEHHIDLPEDKVDVVAEMVAELDSKEEKLSEAVQEIVSLRRELNEEKKADIIAEMSSDMTVTQQEKLEKLVEGIEHESIDEFVSKAKVIKEHYFSGKKIGMGDDVSEIEDSVSTEVQPHPIMSQYASAISRSLKK